MTAPAPRLSAAPRHAAGPVIVGASRPGLRRRLLRLGVAGLALAGLTVGATGASYVDGEWAETVVESDHTYNLQISADGTTWQDTSLGGLVADHEFEPESGASLSAPITVAGGGNLIPGVSQVTTVFYIKNASTLPSSLVLQLQDPAASQGPAAAADEALLGLLSFTLAVYDGADAGVFSSSGPIAVGADPVDLGITAPPGSVYRFVVTATVDNALTGTGDIDQAATNAAQGGAVGLRAVVAGEDTY